MMRMAQVRREWAFSVVAGRIGPLLGSLALVFLAGCGGSGLPGRQTTPTGTTVSGTVTWQGKPLPVGRITFVPAVEGEDKSGNNTTITNGRYEVQDPPGLAPGSYKVRIRARGTKKQGPAGEIPKDIPDFDPTADPLLQEQIPEKYNDETTLTAEIAQGSNTKNFDLTGTRSPEARPFSRADVIGSVGRAFQPDIRRSGFPV
jgi:hypothetical protein